MFKLLPFVLCMICATASAATPANRMLAMGPDPGGHTGARVTPETTKTDRPEVDAARKAASGSKTESNPPVPTGQSESKSQSKSSKPAN